MGLIQMIKGTVSSTLKDMTVDVFECSRMSSEMLGAPATKVVRSGAVNNATDNVISNGSLFNVSHNQAAILVENGRVHDFIIATSEDMAGQYRYDSAVEPSLLGGGFKDFVPSLKNMVSRFTAGGQSTNVMRLYYINCQIITGNPIGIGGITFRDGETGVNVKAQAHGKYEFQIVNPVVFYENYVKRIDEDFSTTSSEGKALLSTMKMDMSPEYTKALGMLSQQGIRYEQLASYSNDITNLMRKGLEQEWLERRGIQLIDTNLEITFDEESVKEVIEIQKLKNYTDPALLRAKMGFGMTSAAEAAANNSAGAMTGFLGMGMAANTMGAQFQGMGMGNPMASQPYNPNAQPTVVASLDGSMQPQMATNMSMQQPQMQPGMAAGMTGADMGQPSQEPAPAPQPSADAWTCTCGATNDGKFCMECGVKKPEANPTGWTCACGTVNKGKFCQECGAKKPADAPLYKCDKCNWEPEDPKNPPKFCPQCGDKFDDSDITNA